MTGAALILAWLLFSVLVKPYSTPWPIELAALTILLLGLAGCALEFVVRKAYALLVRMGEEREGDFP